MPFSESAGSHGYKHVVAFSWVPALGLQLKLGVDGIGVAMVLLTAITIFAGVCVSFSIRERVKEYYLNLIALDTSIPYGRNRTGLATNWCLRSRTAT